MSAAHVEQLYRLANALEAAVAFDTAARLGILDYLHETPACADEVIRYRGTAPKVTLLLLDALRRSERSNGEMTAGTPPPPRRGGSPPLRLDGPTLTRWCGPGSPSSRRTPQPGLLTYTPRPYCSWPSYLPPRLSARPSCSLRSGAKYSTSAPARPPGASRWLREAGYGEVTANALSRTPPLALLTCITPHRCPKVIAGLPSRR
ncbi:MAG: hypothetical protein M3143_11465 [Actinomycetota bacterium]|nr:hypothetical protein [Actinomycetota bacterium]